MIDTRLLALPVCLVLATSCASRVFRVVPGTPNYFLRYPDSAQRSFPDVLRLYNDFQPGGSMYLRAGMELRVENAYYEPGSSRRGLEGFLGTEIARYNVLSDGHLQLSSVQSMKNRPADALPVQNLTPSFQTDYRYHRFYYEILFRRAGQSRGSVLLSTNSLDEMNRLASQLQRDPESVCDGRSTNCTVFPEACSVSVEMEIVLNGKPENVVWGSVLSSVVGNAHSVQLFRMNNGRLVPVKLNIHDSEALELPLLPGDHVNWRKDRP